MSLYKQYVIAILCLSVVLICAERADSQTALQKKVDSLFVIASSGEVMYQHMVEPAKEALANIGEQAVPLLINKFTTKSARERHTIIEILKKIGSPGVPHLVKALTNPDPLIVQRVCWAMGDIGDSSAVMPLISVADHSDWQVRDQAIGALGDIGDKRAEETVVRSLVDSVGQVRKSGSVSAGKIGVSVAVPELVHMMGDDFYGARMSAVHSLLQLDTALVIDALGDSLDSHNPLVGDLGCYVLGQIGSDRCLELLHHQTANRNPNRRAHAAVALVGADPLDNCGFRQGILDRETDRLVRLKIESAIHAVGHE